MRQEQPSINLADLVKDPSRVEEVDRSYLPALLAQLSAMQASVAARLLSTSQEAITEREDALLDAKQAAERLGVSADWLYRRTSRLPFVVRVGRNVRFSARGIEKFIRSRTGAK
jgi:predicted DNA-binding transcriptional regulator AlpA